MKFYIAIAALAISADAFAPSSFGVRRSTSLANSRVDSSEAVAAAVAAGKKYGPASPEARLAWEAVEEMDASDNSVVYDGADDDCLVDKPSEACLELESKLGELEGLMDTFGPKMDRVKELALDIRAIKMNEPEVATSSQDSPALQNALKNAKAITEKSGIESAEARLAWETVEDIASAGYGEALKGRLDDECLVETIEACEALDELSQALQVNQQKGNRYQG